MQTVPHQCRRPGRPSSRDSSPSTFHPLSRLPPGTRLKSLLLLLLHPLKRYLPDPDSPTASVSSCSPPVPIIWHVQHAGHTCLLTSSWMRMIDASQVRHKKPKAKPAAQPPLEALQPFEQRQRQQQLQQAAAPAAAEPDYRHVPPPPPPPPPQPEAPQPPAAFDSKPAPWAHKRAAAAPGTSLLFPASFPSFSAGSMMRPCKQCAVADHTPPAQSKHCPPETSPDSPHLY